jgi:hypothetical protein
MHGIRIKILSRVEEYLWNVLGLLRSLNSTFLKNKFKLHCREKTCPEFQAVTGFLCDNLSISAAIFKDRISKYFSVYVCVCMYVCIYTVCLCACAGP